MMEWSTHGGQCIDDEKLLACSYYRNFVGVWVADVSVLSDQVEFYIYIYIYIMISLSLSWTC